MEAMAQVGILAAATVLAAGTAFLMAWAFLRGAFRLMLPAGASPRLVRTAASGPTPRSRLELVEGTRAAARAFARS
jgi:hypothetical protein